MSIKFPKVAVLLTERELAVRRLLTVAVLANVAAFEMDTVLLNVAELVTTKVPVVVTEACEKSKPVALIAVQGIDPLGVERRP